MSRPAASGGNALGEMLFPLGSQCRIAQGLTPVRHRRRKLVEEMIDTLDRIAA